MSMLVNTQDMADMVGIYKLLIQAERVYTTGFPAKGSIERRKPNCERYIKITEGGLW